MIKVITENVNTERYLNKSNINYFSLQMENRFLFKMTNNEIFFSNDSKESLHKLRKHLEQTFIYVVLEETKLETYINTENICYVTPQVKGKIIIHMTNGEDVIAISNIDTFLSEFRIKSTFKTENSEV